MKTILEVLTLSVDYLKKKEIANARRQAEELLAEALGLKRMDLYLEHDRPLTEVELVRCREWLQRRSKGEPLQYIKGQVEFYGNLIHVNQDVLIPRQETEILVSKIAESLATRSLNNKVLWDICCGSGCIAIALKKKFPDLLVAGSDVSPRALSTARRNISENGVEVELLEGDLFAPFKGRKTNFLVCNPPYIAEKEFQDLDVEVKNFEPKSALISGTTGLEFYERLHEQILNYLLPGAKVWFEIGHGQGEALKKLFSHPPFKNVIIENDWSGKERFFSLEFE